MRSIKFRGKVRKTRPEIAIGKRPEDGTWVVGDLHYLYAGHPHIHFGLQAKISIDPDTIGQYTGLKDKNGKEIYEGDIIRFVNGQKKVNGEWVDNEFIYTVEYSEGAFCGVLGLSKTLDAVEVIGNIYDNPELLKNES